MVTGEERVVGNMSRERRRQVPEAEQPAWACAVRGWRKQEAWPWHEAIRGPRTSWCLQESGLRRWSLGCSCLHRILTCCSGDQPPPFLGRPPALFVFLPTRGMCRVSPLASLGNLAGRSLPPPSEAGTEHFQRGWQSFLPAKWKLTPPAHPRSTVSMEIGMAVQTASFPSSAMAPLLIDRPSPYCKSGKSP